MPAKFEHLFLILDIIGEDGHLGVEEILASANKIAPTLSAAQMPALMKRMIHARLVVERDGRYELTEYGQSRNWHRPSRP
jgi:predicted transcriptional regulator